MVKASRRLPSSVNVSQSALDVASSTLLNLPEKPKESWSLREAVSVLQESISLALSKGYNYDEVSAVLSEKGVAISASSLKSYLSAAKRQKGLTSPRGRRSGRRSQKVEADVSMNGAAHIASEIVQANGAKLEAVSEQPKTRQTRSTDTTKTAAKAKSAAKTTRKAVSAQLVENKSGRGRKKK